MCSAFSVITLELLVFSVPSVEDGIDMEYLEGGDLERYITTNPELAEKHKLHWILAVAEALQYLHDKEVIHNDFALRNILIAKDRSLKLIDFSNSLIEAEREESDKVFTIHSDIFDLASVAYSILSWAPYHLKLLEYQLDFKGNSSNCNVSQGWPTRKDLPDLTNVPHGELLLGCWLRQFKTVRCVCTELHRLIVALDEPAIELSQPTTHSTKEPLLE